MNVERVRTKIPTIFDSFIAHRANLAVDTGMTRGVGAVMNVLVARVMVATEMRVDRRPRR